ncbi:MAG: toxin-antitoxin system YwqK family antitoxin [Bacteroidetes bacterium]|nr:toxin-antitoxin system YwqK family antitoxin [Bacteroidota bacterium]
MKNLLTWILIILIFEPTFSQKKCFEDSIDAEGYIVSDCGRKKGVINFDEKLIAEPGTNIILWDHNKQPFNGECESCFSHNEKTRFRIKVENGNINGKYISNYESGCIQERGTKIMGKFDGLIELFYDSTNAVKEITNYNAGKIDGSRLFLSPNGDTISFENYKVISKKEITESILHGVQKFYFSNGKMESEINYNLGLLDGTYKKYNSDGILVNDRNFKKGKQNGNCVSYYEDGKKMLEENWKEGLKNGTFTFYLPNDSVQFIENYMAGIPHGIFEDYHRNRQIKSKVEYKKGIIIFEQYWNEFGQDITSDKKKEQNNKEQSEDGKSDQKKTNRKKLKEEKGKEEEKL